MIYVVDFKEALDNIFWKIKTGIVATPETKIDASITYSKLFHDNLGFGVFRSDRTLDGGVVLIEKVWNASPVSVTHNVESVWAKVNLGDTVH